MGTLIIPLVDGTFAAISWFVAVEIRRLLGENAPNFSEYIKFGILLGAITITVFSRSGFYEESFLRSRTARPYALMRGHITALLVFILLSYFFSDQKVSRGTVLIYSLVSFQAIYVGRLASSWILRFFRSQQTVLLVGSGQQLRIYLERVLTSPHLGISPVAWVDPPAWASEFNIPVATGNWREKISPHTYIISYNPEDSEKIDRFVQDYYNDVTRIHILPAFNSYALLGVQLELVAGVSVMTLNQPRHSVIDLMVKRLIDFTGALIGMIVLLPVFILLGILVRCSSRGPIFFGQERMGLDGHTFKMWKFRTMNSSGPAQPGWTVEADPRRTRIGTFLRTFSLDELPQLWNVLIGDMSLVGPRPEQPFFVNSFKREIPSYMLRHKMKAGMTGWAQVNGWRGNTSLHKRIECDIYYIKNWSLWLDFKIIALTFWTALNSKNAY